MRRYAVVEKAKDADVIGILVGTLGVCESFSPPSLPPKLISRLRPQPHTFRLSLTSVNSSRRTKRRATPSPLASSILPNSPTSWRWSALFSWPARRTL